MGSLIPEALLRTLSGGYAIWDAGLSGSATLKALLSADEIAALRARADELSLSRTHPEPSTGLAADPVAALLTIARRPR